MRAGAKRDKLTPPRLADKWGISPEKVLGWIRTGELRAINIAALQGGRPRYLIDEADLADFEKRREAKTSPPLQSRKRKQRDDVTEYF
jgi:hypothetical protein